MKPLAAVLVILIGCLVTTALGQQTCNSDTGGKCCECTLFLQGEQHDQTCTCECYSLILYCTTNSTKDKCLHNRCALARTSAETMAQYPWITMPRIVRSLSEHSVLPHPMMIYDLVQTAELKTGPVSHRGVVADPEQKQKYVEWWDADDDVTTNQSHLKMWLDTNGVWKSTADVHHSSIRLPVVETVDLYQDHWTQTNAKGTFTGPIEPFPDTCLNDKCALGRISAETLAQYPWMTMPGIVRSLSEHSVLPHPIMIYDLVQTSELKTGPVGHSGVAGDPEQKQKYVEWWDANDDVNTHQSHLKIWLDANGIWKSTADIQDNTIRLPVSETVDFYQDHWEQTNVKGTFRGTIEPFPSISTALLKESSLIK
jgi:hypothetical protein